MFLCQKASMCHLENVSFYSRIFYHVLSKHFVSITFKNFTWKSLNFTLVPTFLVIYEQNDPNIVRIIFSFVLFLLFNFLYYDKLRLFRVYKVKISLAIFVSSLIGYSHGLFMFCTGLEYRKPYIHLSCEVVHEMLIVLIKMSVGSITLCA
jgi:hypothetical protein